MIPSAKNNTLLEGDLELLRQAIHDLPPLPNEAAAEKPLWEIQDPHQADQQRKHWSNLRKEEQAKRKHLTDQFHRQRAQQQRKSLQKLFATQQKKPTKLSMAVLLPTRSLPSKMSIKNSLQTQKK
jgi:hypothetical protein